MIRMLWVEWRKLLRRKEVYILTLILVFLSFFVNYQLSLDNPALKIERTDGQIERISLPDLTHLMANVLDQTGIFTVMLAVIVWNIIGREHDQKIVRLYFVNRPSRLDVYGAKILLSLKVMSILFLLFISSLLLFASIIQPDQVEITFTGENWLELGKVSLLHMFMFFIYTLCAFLFSLCFGSMGTLMGTIGIWLLFTFLKFVEDADRLNPLIINDIFSLKSFSESILLNCLYVVVLGGILIFFVMKKDVQ